MESQLSKNETGELIQMVDGDGNFVDHKKFQDFFTKMSISENENYFVVSILGPQSG